MLWNHLERDGCFNTFECGNCGYVITAAEGEPLPRHCPNCGGEEGEVEGGITDNEIKNALEYCKRPVGQHDCQNCPYVQSKGMCTTNLLNDTIDLFTRLQAENNKYRRKVQNQRDEINRQKAKIEELTKTCEHQQNLNIDSSFEVKELKAEIERLQKRALPTAGFVNLLCGALIYTKTLEEYNRFRRTIKAEIVKEFAEDLKKRADELKQVSLDGKWAISQYDVDKLLKEKVGEGK